MIATVGNNLRVSVAVSIIWRTWTSYCRRYLRYFWAGESSERRITLHKYGSVRHTNPQFIQATIP